MRADFHVHSAFSDDSSYPIEEVCRDACRLGLDAICITDHVDYGVKPDVSPIDTAGTIFDESYVADPTSITANVYGEREVNVDYQHYFPHSMKCVSALRVQIMTGGEARLLSTVDLSWAYNAIPSIKMHGS